MIEGITNGHLLIAAVLFCGYLAVGVIAGRNREMRSMHEDLEVLVGLMWSIQERQEEVLQAASRHYVRPKHERRGPGIPAEERARMEAELAKQ